MYKQGYTIFTGPLKNGPKGQNAVRKAEKSGQQVLSVKKGQHQNKHGNLDPKYVAKIMNEEDDYKPASMPQDLRLAISQSRNAKGWTQQQFAHRLCVQKTEINAWEAGKSLPNGNMIAKMDKILGVKLPRPPKK